MGMNGNNLNKKENVGAGGNALEYIGKKVESVEKYEN